MTIQPTNNLLIGLGAEKTVLGALLLDPDAILKVASYLEVSDFVDPVLADIYGAVLELHEKRAAIDFVTVANQLQENDRINRIGGSAFLADLAASTPTSSHIDQYAQIVHQNGNKRALQKLGKSIAAGALDSELSFADSWASASENLLALGQRDLNEKPVQLSSISKNRYDVFTEVQAGNDQEQKRRVPSGSPTSTITSMATSPSRFISSLVAPAWVRRHSCSTWRSMQQKKMQSGFSSSRSKCPRSR